MGHILAVDQRTTSTRAIDRHRELGRCVEVQKACPQYAPASGYVQHSTIEPWATTLSTCRAAMDAAAQAF